MSIWTVKLIWSADFGRDLTKGGRAPPLFMILLGWLRHGAFRSNPRSGWTRDRIIPGRVILSLEQLGIPPRIDGGGC